MQSRSRQELYRSFIEFIRDESERERLSVNKRMFSVFLWCFLMPTTLSVVGLLLVKFRIIPPQIRGARNYLHWMILVFPVSYSIFFLSSEVLKDAPKAFRRGGVGTNLDQTAREGEWRERVCAGMKKALDCGPSDWKWILASFRMDLEGLQYRTRYLTALAGAVFFLIMQGIDSIGDGEKGVAWLKNPIVGWVEVSSTDPSQFVGLALFLVLLYLSGSQNYHSLHRFLNCVELIALEGPAQD